MQVARKWIELMEQGDSSVSRLYAPEARLQAGAVTFLGRKAVQHYLGASALFRARLPKIEFHGAGDTVLVQWLRPDDARFAVLQTATRLKVAHGQIVEQRL